MPASAQNTDTPVRVSPLMICHGMALPPRYLGSEGEADAAEPWVSMIAGGTI
jgi:hypothetical protein